MSVRGAWLEELTWPEVKRWIDRDPVLLVPIGAISKQHGHHLPMNTDYLTARALTGGVIERIPALAAPVISFGYYPAFVRYPGSLHLSAETFITVLREVIGKFIGDGFRLIVIINTGVSTEAPVNIVTRDLYLQTGVRIHVADIRRLGARTDELLQQKLGGHADEAETSTTLAIRPDLVRMDLAKPDYGNLLNVPDTVFHQPAVFSDDPESIWDHSLTGARGDPSLATREKGEAILQAMIDDLVQGLNLLFPKPNSN